MTNYYFLIGHAACYAYLVRGLEALLLTDFEVVAYPEDQLIYLGSDTQGRTILKISEDLYNLLNNFQNAK